MNNLNAIYERILEVLREISKEQLLHYQRRQPKMSDLELISLSLTAEYLGIDSENDLFRKLSLCMKAKIERTVYNRRRRRLSNHLNAIRLQLASFFNEFEDCFIVDSMPLKVCKLSRASRSKICKEDFESSPNKGYCASQTMHYYGYKLHAVCSVNGVIGNFDLSQASVHDVHYLKDIQNQMKDCVLLADKGYLSTRYQLDLFEFRNIKLEVPMRKNQCNFKQQPYVFRKSRKRIETLFSQLCDQFMIRRNYAKSFQGFKTRILTKITALTIIQYLNKFEFNRNINNLKVNIA